MSKLDSPGTIFAGLMSGTSMDGIDAALVRLGDRQCEVIHADSSAYPDALRQALRDIVRDPGSCNVDDIGHLDRWVGECFRDAALALLDASGTSPVAVRAIGSHGQTIRHQPRADKPFTLQIGDPNVIAAGTGIDTVADFRRRDMAHGGEGAPLAAAFHAWLFADKRVTRVILNLGGIANITVLPADGEPFGFDTGPGNTLLDAWVESHTGHAFDNRGQWAASGKCSEALLEALLADRYFDQPPPKSTGLEYFNLAWLQASLEPDFDLAPEDVQATLSQLTASSVAQAVRKHAATATEVLVCGGGSRNLLLMDLLATLLPGSDVRPTDAHGLDADWVEAAAFAWLARQFVEKEPGNLPSVTGADRKVVLGSLFPGTA
jgi:anhydro-N-acetylmuramic acid kinase